MRLRWLMGLVMFLIASAASAQKSLIPTPDSHVKIGFYVADTTKFDPGFPWVATYDQPAEYAQWWKDVKHCAGADSADVSSVSFYEVNTKSTFSMLDSTLNVMRWATGDIIQFNGLTDIPRDQIFLPIGRVFNEDDVKHEMLHAVLYHAGRKHGHGDPGVKEAFDTCHLDEYAKP